MKRKDFWTDEEGRCGTVDFVQIELQRCKTLLLDVKIRVSALLYRSLSRIKYKSDCEKRTESPSPVFNISCSFCIARLLFRTVIIFTYNIIHILYIILLLSDVYYIILHIIRRGTLICFRSRRGCKL